MMRRLSWSRDAVYTSFGKPMGDEKVRSLCLACPGRQMKGLKMSMIAAWSQILVTCQIQLSISQD